MVRLSFDNEVLQMLKKIFLITFILCALSFQVRAEVSFEAGISIEKEAENAAVAKNEAMTEAYREALLNVAGRLTTKENVEKLSELKDEELIHFIQETDVIAEKSTANSYMADLNIKINGDLLKTYMFENNMIEVVSSPADILLVPVFSDTQYQGTVLFEDGNVWRDILLSKGHIKIGNLNMDVIADNMANRAFLTGDNVLNMSAQTYEQIKFINNADNVFVVYAVMAGLNNVVLTVKRFGEQDYRTVISDENGEPLEKAVEEAVNYIYHVMQQKNVDQSAYKSKINVVFYYQKLKDWLELQKKLKTIAQIKNIEAGAMENGKVRFGIDFSGTIEVLEIALKQQGLSLSFENGYYIMTQQRIY